MKKTTYYFFKIIATCFLSIPVLIAKLTKTVFIIREGTALGDHLVITSFIKYIDETYNYKTIILSSVPTLFENNPRIKKIIFLRNVNLCIKIIIGLFEYSYNKHFIYFRYIDREKNDYLELVRNNKYLHLRDYYLYNTPYFKEISGLCINNEIYFSKQEIEKFEKKKYPHSYAITISQAKKSFAPIKDWGYENIQEVITKTPYEWIQLGTSADKKLKNTLDFRDTPLREALYIVSKAKFILCTEGFFTHVSSAFNIPCITIYSGFVPPSVTYYKNIIRIEKEKQYSCAYCTSCGECPVFEKARCIKDITPNRVIKLIKSNF